MTTARMPPNISRGIKKKQTPIQEADIPRPTRLDHGKDLLNAALDKLEEPKFKPRPITRAPRDGERRELRLVDILDDGILTRRYYHYGITNDAKIKELRDELENQRDRWNASGALPNAELRVVDYPAS